MEVIIAISIITVILGSLIYIYLDVYLHPGSYLKKPRRKKKNRKKK